ncbi:hypothetical protein KPL39_08640 [Clostridium gasigenes]|uniref:hypothetical protein n=1 Tax=Clostridium gasigenes TaxID=94869 RepID=UPI001C0C9758|nr:hypothetical protein [Clostridium gasigenes]MBU3136339.1 hypothetical protein [Clostridium gasigenes]
MYNFTYYLLIPYINFLIENQVVFIYCKTLVIFSSSGSAEKIDDTTDDSFENSGSFTSGGDSCSCGGGGLLVLFKNPLF